MSCNKPVISPAIEKRSGAVAVGLVGHRLQLLAAIGQSTREDCVAVFHVVVMRHRPRSPRRTPFAQFHDRIANAHLSVQDRTGATDLLLDYLGAKCMFKEVEEASGVLHAVIGIKLLQNFRLVAYS